MLEKEQSRQNNPKNSYTERKANYKSSCCSMSLNCSSDETKTRCKFYRTKYHIEKFCKDLKQLTIEIINSEEKEMIPLTDKEIKFY